MNLLIKFWKWMYNFWNSNKKVLFDLLITILFLISISSFLILAYKYFQYPPQLDSKGFDTFLDLFSFPIKSFTASLALYVIKLTLKRIDQTQESLDNAKEQMRIIDENNRFNNYFTHYRNFEDSVKNFRVLEQLEKMEKLAYKYKIGSCRNIKQDFLSHIRSYHDEFYSPEPIQFDPRGNNKYLDRISRISHLLDRYLRVSFVDFKISDIKIEELKSIIDLVPKCFADTVFMLSIIDKIHTGRIENNREFTNKDHELSRLYWSLELWKEFLFQQNKHTSEILLVLLSMSSYRKDNNYPQI